MGRRALARRLGRVREQRGRARLRPVSAIRCHRPDVDPAREAAALDAIERAARAELGALGMPPELLLIVGLDEDGTGRAEAGGWRWRLRVEPNGRGGARAGVAACEGPWWRG